MLQFTDMKVENYGKQDWDGLLFPTASQNSIKEKSRFTFLYTVIFIQQYGKFKN